MESQSQNRSEIHTLQVSPTIHEQLSKQFRMLKYNPYVDYYNVALKASEILEKEFAYGILKTIQGFAASKIKEGVILIKGLPVTFSTLPLTPTDDSTTNGKDFLSEYITLGSGQLLKAIPYVNKGEKDGNVVHQIVPIEGQEGEQSSRGSKTSFDWHTENVHELSPPHFLGLFCLKGESDARTQVVPLCDLLDALPNRIVNALFKERFEFKTGPSYNFTSTIQTSVLSKTVEGDIQIRYNSSPDRLRGTDKETEAALSFVRHWLKNHAEIKEVRLEQGDFMIMDNRRVLHGRTSFKMSPSLINRRWLQRVYFRNL